MVRRNIGGAELRYERGAVWEGWGEGLMATMVIASKNHPLFRQCRNIHTLVEMLYSDLLAHLGWIDELTSAQNMDLQLL